MTSITFAVCICVLVITWCKVAGKENEWRKRNGYNRNR